MSFPKSLVVRLPGCMPHAPTAAPATSGTLVVVPRLSAKSHTPTTKPTCLLTVEEQDKDKNAAASRVNAKMKQGTEIVRSADPSAKLKTYGYYTYPVYPVKTIRSARSRRTSSACRIGWRVGQMLEVKTTNLAGLQKTAAAAQKVLQINGIDLPPEPGELAKQPR